MRILNYKKGIIFPLAAYIFLLFANYMRVSIGTPFCFDDCHEYISAMGVPWKGLLHQLVVTWRSWAVPAFFWWFGPYDLRTAQEIVVTQSIMYFMAWVFFAYSVSLWLARTFLGRVIGFVLLCPFVYVKGYYHFNQLLLSDSFALSMVLVTFSLCLQFSLYIRSRGSLFGIFAPLYVIAIVCSGALMVGARDSSILLGFCCAFFVMVVNWGDVSSRWYRLAACVLLLGVGGVQAHWAAKRHLVNAENILVGFALANPEARSFFLAHGMPPEVAEGSETFIQQPWSAVNVQQMLEYRQRVEKNSQFQSFMPQFDKIYSKYVLSHPMDYVKWSVKNTKTIFVDNFQFPHKSSAIFPKFDTEIPPIIGRDIRLPFVDSSRGLILCGFVFFLYLVCLGFRRVSVLPLCIVVVGALSALSGFWGDLWECSEMMRHAAIGSIIVRVGFALALITMLDMLIALVGGRARVAFHSV